MNASLLAEDLARGSIVFAVADGDGEIAGAAAVAIPTSGTAADLCHGAVLPAYRKLDLFRRLQLPLIDEARERGMTALFGRGVTTHPFSQKALASLGAVAVGLTLAAAPRDLRFQLIQDELEQRESFVDLVIVNRDRAAATVHALAPHRPILEMIYGRLGLPVRFATPSDSAPIRVSATTDHELGTSTLHLGARGDIVRDQLPLLADMLEAGGAEAVYAELPLAHPAGPRVAQALRGAGFSFAALLPDRGPERTDVLRLQRTDASLNPDVVRVGIEPASEIKDFVFADRRS